MSTFTWPPAFNAQLNSQPRIAAASFGDGYEQRVKAGINNAPRSWSLTFTNHKDKSAEIENFLIARGALESFNWQPPDGATGKFICKEWSKQYLAPNVRTITATFVEVFGS